MTHQIHSTRLLDACNQELQYDHKQPINIENTRNQNDVPKQCELTINTTDEITSDRKTFFMIRVNLNQLNPDEIEGNTFISIIDHDSDHSAMNFSLLNETAVVKQFQPINFIQVESSCFEINLSNRKESNTKEFGFHEIKSITITAVTHTVENKCGSNEFKCNTSDVCISKKFQCDHLESCSDGSDELNCFNDTATSTTTSTSTAENVLNNSTFVISPVSPADEPSHNQLRYFIGLIVLLAIVSVVLLSVWIYGKRRRKWREFLAQLDNNTDWEYEQLDDNHHPMGVTTTSMPTMSPIFNMNMSGTSGNNRNNERTPIN